MFAWKADDVLTRLKPNIHWPRWGTNLNRETLESLLDGGIETPSFDIKASMPWNCSKLAKHILAMSNVRDGGAILIGVDDTTFNRTGVPNADRATYDQEAMQDQMAQYADPGVEFRVSFPADSSGLTYVAIEVSSFRDVPTICRRDGSGLRKGAIYYRGGSRRVSSAQIDNSYDMRDLLTLAASRTATRYRSFGFVPETDNSFVESLNSEIGDL